MTFLGCPRGHRVEPETRCKSTQSLNFRWILSLEPERLGNPMALRPDMIRQMELFG
jgi:hypothetical protein